MPNASQKLLTFLKKVAEEKKQQKQDDRVSLDLELGLRTYEIFDHIKEMAQSVKNIPKGEQGEKGDKGDKGEQGESIKGEKGEQGEKGDRGDKGEQGDRGEQGEKGEDGKDGKDGKNGIDGVNGKDGLNGKDGSPDTGEQIISKINSDKDSKINKDKIQGIDKLEKELQNAKSIVIGGGGKGVQLFVDGELKGLARSINFIAGTGITLTYSGDGRRDITISNSSVAGTVLVATGTVNSVNTDFTFTTKPSIIVSDGVAYQETNKVGETIWTWNAGTLTATLTIPPQSDIYGIR